MQPPVLLIGAARSGTKFLRGLVAASACVAATEHDMSHIWRRGAGLSECDRLPLERLTPRRAEQIRRDLARAAGLGRADPRRLCDKTVGNVFRIDYVSAVCPDAQFVHILRDGRAVAESAMAAWQRPPERAALIAKLRLALTTPAALPYAAWYAVNLAHGTLTGRGRGRMWGPRYPGMAADAAALPLHRLCARQWAQSVAAAEAGLAGIEPARVLTLRYEDLVAAPETAARLAAFLRLPDPDAVIRRWHESARPDTARWRRTLSPEILADIEAEIGADLARLGYAPAQEGAA